MIRREALGLLLCLSSGAFGAGTTSDRRSANLRTLKSRGFVVAPSLPMRNLNKLRPVSEIRGRLNALHALVLWVAQPDGLGDTERLLASKETDGQWLSKSERAIFSGDRRAAKSKYLDSIGWQMENMWSLGWVLGYGFEPALTGQLEGERARDLVFRFCSAREYRLRAADEVARLEDLFYCAHNAVRSGQLGRPTLPKDFDATVEGGCIHERRHALTWCLSPGVSWEQVDLST